MQSTLKMNKEKSNEKPNSIERVLIPGCSILNSEEINRIIDTLNEIKDIFFINSYKIHVHLNTINYKTPVISIEIGKDADLSINTDKNLIPKIKKSIKTYYDEGYKLQNVEDIAQTLISNAANIFVKSKDIYLSNDKEIEKIKRFIEDYIIEKTEEEKIRVLTLIASFNYLNNQNINMDVSNINKSSEQISKMFNAFFNGIKTNDKNNKYNKQNQSEVDQAIKRFLYISPILFILYVILKNDSMLRPIIIENWSNNNSLKRK